MDKNAREIYNKYIPRLFKYLKEKKYTVGPAPKVRLDDSEQDDKVFMRTGYYDPEKKIIVLFTNGRAIKDVLRSFAHECVHHKQNVEGRLNDGAYDGDRIVDDKKLIMLEGEAYLYGNIGFRSWTEEEKKR